MTRLVKTKENINGLPIGFQEVEYLQSTGTQWIDTGIAGNQTGKIDIIAKSTDTSSNSDGVAIGCGTGNNRLQVYAGKFVSQYWSCRDDGTLIQSTTANIMNITRIVLDIKNKTCLFNNESISYTATGNLSSNNLLLFRRNTTDTPKVGAFLGDIYCCKIWDANDTLVRDFIPCLDVAGKPCMYDKVSGQPFYNQGTGADFNYGREIHPVEYLESTGTQYINMGIKSSANMSVKAKFNLSNASAKAVFGSYSGSSTDGVGVFFGTAGGNITGKVYCNNTNVAVSPDLTLSTNTNYEIEMSGTTLVINGSTYTSAATASNSYDMLLFARSNNGTVERQISGKIYNLKIWDNGTLARNYIPCIDENNVPFMFDKVTHTIFDNAGTGEFSYGNPVASNKGKIRFPVTQHEKSRLPLGFREVEYLQSTGTQWIDTGVAPSNITPIVKLKFIPTQLYSSGNYGIFGCFGANNNRFQIFYNSIGIGTYVSKTWPANTAYEVELNGKVPSATVNGTVETSGYSNANGFSSYNMYLFTRNSADVADNGVPLKLYYCKIWNNGVLVRDFIPCLDNNGIPCMYDLVGKKPYYNQGTGADFNYGREIHYVEYLESSGTQYINTGYAANANTIVEYNFNLVEVPSSSAFFGSGTSSTSTDRFQGYYESSLSFSTKLASTTTYSDVTLTAGTKHYSKMGIPLAGYYIDDTFIASATGTPTSLNLYVFARNINGSMQVPIKMKLYDFKISENNSLVRDYIPAIDENNVGFLFDRVTHTAFLNAGTGDFLYGNLLKQNKLRIVLPHPIPLIYKPVEYIESTGTQYIDTGITGTNENLGIDVNWAFSNNNANMCIFSSRSAQTSNSFTLFWLKTASNRVRFDTTGQPYFADGVNTSVSDDIFNFNYKSAEGAIATLTNKTTGDIQTLNVGKLTTFSTNPLYLFASRDAGAVGSSIKMYKCKIYNGSTLVRDYVPVIRRSDKKPGFYCKVTKQFFTNAGTGEFLFG